MQTTNQLYKDIVGDPSHEFYVRARFASSPEFVVTEANLIKLSTTRQVMSDFWNPIGNVCIGECEIEFIKPDITIPRNCGFTVEVQAFRVVNGTEQVAPWLPKGTFFIDTRKSDKYGDYKSMTVHAYDALRRSETEYPSTTHAWPASTSQVVSDICGVLGVQPDSRNVYSSKTYGLPAGYYCREVLSYIAAIECGNWVMTEQNTLRLLKLSDIPDITSYLIDEHGDPITFGGTRIIVGGDDAG